MKKVSLIPVTVLMDALSFVFLVFFVIALGACSSTGSADDVEAAVKAAFQEYGASLEAADADRWGALWTEDGLQYPPGAPALEGKEALVDDLRSALEVITISDMQINVEEVQVAGDWAYARGTYSYVLGLLPDDGSDPAFVDGKYMSIFQKQDDGSWKLHRDVYNYNSADPEKVDSVADVVGTWRSTGSPKTTFMRFFEDGTYVGSRSLDRLEERPAFSGEFWFEGARFFERELIGGCGSPKEGSYEVYLQPNGNLRFVLIADECSYRIHDYTGGGGLYGNQYEGLVEFEPVPQTENTE